MLDFIASELEEIKREGLYRSLRCVEGHQGARITLDGRDCINLCSNNYLGLANNPGLKRAAVQAVQKYGCGSGASRLVCGNLSLHTILEERLAQFKGQESALVFNSGYCTNLGLIASLVGRGDCVFSDRLNHASIYDAILLSRAELKRYPHRDMDALKCFLEKARHYKKRLIVTDTVFSMDGDIAPLPEIVDLARRFDAMIMVDEAHATGVFGMNRRGLVEHFGLEDEIAIQMGTLSKAIGSCGGYVAGKKALCAYLINTARPFIYTTALPPSVLASCIAAIDIIEHQAWVTKALWDNVRFLRRGLIDKGFDLMGSESQIMPILIGESKKTVEFSRLLLEKGLFIQAIRPPSVPQGSARLRLTVTAAHKRQDLERALEIIGTVGKDSGIIS